MPKLYKQTVDDIKSEYPNAMTALHNRDLEELGEDITCNYCVGGALQMAFGEIKRGDDDALEGIFPATDVLADTLHYFCKIPYSKTDALCHFHNDKDCFTNHGETAYALANEITRANDRGDLDYAWSCVEVALKYKENN